MEVPGFVDLQINGYLGINFSGTDLTKEECYQACKKIIQKGTAVFLPTIITSSTAVLRRNLDLVSEVIQYDDLRDHIPGIHLEGPFLSPVDGARGAHNADWIRVPDLQLFDEFYKWSRGSIKLLTIAADSEGADTLCRHAVNLGITVSLGHHLATEADLERLQKAGATSLTHLGNGLPLHIHRHVNPVWAGLANDHLTAMIIPDGQHLPPSALKTFLRTKGIERICATSDASPIAGLPPGKYNAFGIDAILEESGRFYNPETGYLVGSSYLMIDCMNYLMSLKLVDIHELLEIGYYNPLRLIHIDPASVAKNLRQLVAFKNNEFTPLGN